MTYIPSPKSDLLASYDYVKSSGAQIVDARPFADFGKGRIPGAISLDPAKILENGRVRIVQSVREYSAVFPRISLS